MFLLWLLSFGFGLGLMLAVVILYDEEGPSPAGCIIALIGCFLLFLSAAIAWAV